jgi:hypothetical protein
MWLAAIVLGLINGAITVSRQERDKAQRAAADAGHERRGTIERRYAERPELAGYDSTIRRGVFLVSYPTRQEHRSDMRDVGGCCAVIEPGLSGALDRWNLAMPIWWYGTTDPPSLSKRESRSSGSRTT